MKTDQKESGIEVAKRIREDMVVHAAGRGANVQVGTVKGIKRGLFIKLHKRDTPDETRRYIPLSWVESVEGETIHLSRDADTVRREWLDKAATKRTSSDHAVGHRTKPVP